MEKQRYHILTPMPPEELRTVNCLLVGAVSVPHSVFKSQVSGVGPRTGSAFWEIDFVDKPS